MTPEKTASAPSPLNLIFPYDCSGTNKRKPLLLPEKTYSIYVTLPSCHLRSIAPKVTPSIKSDSEAARQRGPATWRGDAKVPVSADTMRGHSRLNKGLSFA